MTKRSKVSFESAATSSFASGFFSRRSRARRSWAWASLSSSQASASVGETVAAGAPLTAASQRLSSSGVMTEPAAPMSTWPRGLSACCSGAGSGFLVGEKGMAAAGSGTAGAGADGVGVAWACSGCAGAAVAGAAATAAPWRNCTSSLTGSKAACSRHASMTAAFFATLFATMRMGVSTWRTPSSSCTGVHFCSMASRAAGAPSPVSRSRESCHRASASDSRDSSILAAFPRVPITSAA